LVIPADPASNKIIVSIHVYEPYTFSLNRGTAVSWDKNNIAHTSPITNPIDRAYHKFVSNGIPVIIGEFASSKNNNINDRVEWTKFYVNYAMSKGLRSFVWDCGVDDIFWNFDRSANTWKYPQVLDALIQTANGSFTELPTNITGNLGNYIFGTDGDGSTNYTHARWELSNDNVILAKTSGTKLVLQLSNAPSATMQLVWQGPTSESWWNANDILGETGNVINGLGVTWNAGTNTLTINLSEALADYAAFVTQPDLNLIIAYYGGNSVNVLGIMSANLE
jgi:hypothetical protein